MDPKTPATDEDFSRQLLRELFNLKHSLAGFSELIDWYRRVSRQRESFILGKRIDQPRHRA
jgi:hypothetical protein